ncbi:hypothetical protein DYB32_003761 [Aphanomyces invadans]|uniref:Uncharacterized protein n=1 Tax=Aphanomyces invadans TaxID=157072 RepID=A0A3R6VND5_9STRA|nr:hypothetical protein DYB32_003761 [Aphanomyces invadans]
MDQPHSLYGMLQRRKWPKKTHRPSSRYRREAAARYSAVSSPTKDAVNSNVGSVLDLERISDEAKLMQQHDFDVKVSSGNLSTIIHEVSLYDSFDDLELDKIEATIAVDPSGDDILFTNDECLQTAAIPAPSPPTSPPRRRQHVLLELDHRASVIESEVTVKAHENAVAAVDATLASIQKFVRGSSCLDHHIVDLVDMFQADVLSQTRLVRKLRAVDRRKALLMAHVEARAHALRVVGAALTVQRNFRRRQIARRAKFGAMRRRHAKKVVAAVKVQSIARMYLAMNELRRMRTTYPTAALVIQCAVRRHQRAHANQDTKLWMALQDTASTVQKQRLKWMQMEPPQAAMCIQGGWKGYKTRKRLARQFAKDKERDRRLANRSRRVAATCIQRHVRGMLGRKRFWFALMTKYATSIQRLFRNRKARRDIAVMRAYVKAARLIQTRWLNKKEFVQFRRHRRAAVAIQSVVRMWLDKKRFVQRVEAFHRRLEVRLVGQVLFAQRTLDVVQTQLLQLSWQFATHTAADTAVTKKHYQPSPMLAAAASGNVQRALYSRDADGMWTTMGCFGLWQTIYLDVCRHGNTPDAVEIGSCEDVTVNPLAPPNRRGSHVTHPPLGFHNAMSYLLTLRYPDKATALTMEQRFLTFMHELVLVSKFGEAYRLNLAALAMERASWAAHVIQSMCRRRQQLKRHQAFVQRLKDDVVRSAFTYKLRKVVGLAPTLASDTVDEVHAAQQRKDNVVAALGWATYDYTKGLFVLSLPGMSMA